MSEKKYNFVLTMYYKKNVSRQVPFSSQDKSILNVFLLFDESYSLKKFCLKHKTPHFNQKVYLTATVK